MICPICHYEHVEADKEWCIKNGEFVHLLPELVDEKPSFQVGALASQLPSLSWSEIANFALEAGKSADLEIQKQFDNSIRGLPYKPRHVTKDELAKLRDNHIWHSAPSLENVEMVFGTIDVMDSFVSYAVFAWDVNDNLHMIADGKLQYIELDDVKRAGLNEDRRAEGLPPIETVEDLMMKDYLKNADGVGIKATFWMIDQGGHRADDVKHLAKMHRNVIMQKGTTMSSMNWRMSDNQEKLILTNEKYWRSTAIYYLYSQKNREENFLWFNPDISEETLTEIRDVRPDESSKWGNEPENWCSKTGQDHAFDLLKYAYCARDFALQTFMKSRYRFAKSPLILRRFEKQKKKEEAKQQSDVQKSTWFSL